ncbi:unnamed protein product [Eruca vesicaria subsp. sativa]|uniref:Gnk2-homologous domain-containing protein n=1 Tax=Eruca vesicaria subsp. sativa TaxID=29727 RepID=A0ABC8K3W9_ERUVS|nr:unnamed protein product [Eruca vesicaria subsp. sativa]
MSPFNTIITISVVIAAASLIRNFSSPSDNNTFLYYHHCTHPNYFRGSSFFSKYLPGSTYESNVNSLLTSLYLPGSTYESNVNSLLTSLVNSANVFTYNHFTVGNYGKTVHGMHHCHSDLSTRSDDCARCVAQASRILQSLCGGAAGGTLLLEGCFVEYENTKFLGVANKTLLARVCGTPWGYSSDELTKTSKMVSFVVGPTNVPYRAWIGEGAQAVAQCTEDLIEANLQLKSLCGVTAWGEVHLAKCYVRYWSRGATGHGCFSALRADTWLISFV